MQWWGDEGAGRGRAGRDAEEAGKSPGPACRTVRARAGALRTAHGAHGPRCRSGGVVDGVAHEALAGGARQLVVKAMPDWLAGM